MSEITLNKLPKTLQELQAMPQAGLTNPEEVAALTVAALALYPENRKTTLHVSPRFRGRLVFVRDENEAYKCVGCTLCEKSCPNDTIKIVTEMVEDPETGKKKRKLVDYQYDLGDCMFCELCVNACNFGAIKFVNDFENAVFDRNKLVMHLDKEVYKGGSLPNLIDGGAPLEIGKFNTKTK